MLHTILVTYASRSGSTAEVAHAIGETLAATGVPVDVRPLQDVNDPNPYQAVVIGSAVQDGQWLPEAMQFVQTHQIVLRQKRCALFLVCMTLAMPKGDQYRAHVATWLEPVRTLVTPISEGLFAGTLDIRKIPAFGDRVKFRLSTLFGVWREGDHRDWDAIRAWATDLRALLVSECVEP